MSGERKTECDKQAAWPTRKYEKTLRSNYDTDLPAYENKKAAWDKARDTAINRDKSDVAAIENALNALGPRPSPPLQPMLTCPEPTFEGLCKLFAAGRPSLGLFSTEGGQFIGGHGMADENKLRTAAGLSALWDGEPIRRVRAGEGASILPGRRLAAHLMVQPEVADMLLSDRLLIDQGMLSRVLVTAPQSAAGTRLWREERPETDRDLKRYGARVLEILEAPLPLSAGKSNELEPRPLPLSAEARRLWIGFADHIEQAIAPGSPLEPVRGIANKLPEHAARLASVLTLVRDLHAAEIVDEEMRAGIALAEHYAAEALRLFDAKGTNPELRLAQRLLNWLMHHWNEPAISLPDIYQRSLNAIRDQATARKLVKILDNHGWLVEMPGGAVVAGQRRREAWRIVRGPS